MVTSRSSSACQLARSIAFPTSGAPKLKFRVTADFQPKFKDKWKYCGVIGHPA